jgi:hypothetical protein
MTIVSNFLMGCLRLLLYAVIGAVVGALICWMGFYLSLFNTVTDAITGNNHWDASLGAGLFGIFGGAILGALASFERLQDFVIGFVGAIVSAIFD